jgi:hypothetical protein
MLSVLEGRNGGRKESERMQEGRKEGEKESVERNKGQ